MLCAFVATIGCTTGDLSLNGLDVGPGAGQDAAGRDGSTVTDARSDACPFEQCSGVCFDTTSNALHCGRCNNSCPSDATCIDSNCVCPQGLTACGEQCVNTRSDPAHCGSCGNVCAADQVCNGSSCQSGCGELSACSRACVDTTSDAQHCGSCGTVCGSGQACVQSACTCAGQVSSFSEVESLLGQHCSGNGCHTDPPGPNGPAEGLNLGAVTWYDSVVNIPATQCRDGRLLVAPGDADASYLIDKMLGEDMCGGSVMPKAGRGLPREQVALVASWICQGANR